MLGNTLMALLVLGLTMHHVTAQDDGRPTGPPSGPDVGTAKPPGSPPRGPPSEGVPSAGPGPRPPPGGPRPPPGTPRPPPGPRPTPRAPPSRPPPPTCRLHDFPRPLTKIVTYNGTSYRCYSNIRVRGCRGNCRSDYFTNPQTLVAEKSCSCCQPANMDLRTFPIVVYRCRGEVPQRERTEKDKVVPVATACRCKSC